MRSSFSGLIFGLIFSIVLVYLLIVVNFQSWLDPFIIIYGATGRAGRDRLGFCSSPHTTISVPALDWVDHVHGRGDGQQHSGGKLREGAA